jgi:uncharacterized protein
MTLKQQLMEDMKTAMKARDTARLSTIRLLNSEIKNVEIDQGELDDAGVQKVAQKMVKQWIDAKADYQKGAREDLVKEAEGRLEVLNEYLPAKMSESDLRIVVQQIVDDNDNSQFGPLMGQVMKKVGSQADAATVSKILKELLAD